jgi:hypothetical protein
MKLDLDQVRKAPTGESLPSRWAVGLGECFESIQVNRQCCNVMILKLQKNTLSSEIYSQLASSRKLQQGSSHFLYNIAYSDVHKGRERKKLQSWLSSLRPQLRHEDIMAKRSKGTGAWYLNSPTFKAWVSYDGIQTLHVLWSVGAPGAGKSILW